MKRVLWIEDQTDEDLPDLFAEAVADGIAVTVAEDSTGGILEMQSGEFDFVIVDVRTMPGTDERWCKYFYDQCLGQKTVARLGIQLLRVILDVNPEVHLKNKEKPKWLTRDRIGILSVEELRFIESDLQHLDIPTDQYSCKSDGPNPALKLRDLIRHLDHKQSTNHAPQA